LKYADLSNVACDLFSIIPHGVGVDASFFLGRDVISRRQSKTTREMLREKVVVRQLTPVNSEILAGNCAVQEPAKTENDLELKTLADARIVHRMAKVHYLLEIWQGCHNRYVTQKESRAQNKQMTAIGYISDTEEIIVASWSNFQHDGVAAFNMSE